MAAAAGPRWRRRYNTDEHDYQEIHPLHMVYGKLRIGKKFESPSKSVENPRSSTSSALTKMRDPGFTHGLRRALM